MRNIEPIIRETNETLLGQWGLHCSPMNQGRYTGYLYVTDKALYFNVPFNKMLHHLIDIFSLNSSTEYDGNSTANVLKRWERDNYLSIFKTEIKEILVKTTFLKKRVIIILKDENEIMFYHIKLFFTENLEKSIMS